jgi:hypothetical protein
MHIQNSTTQKGTVAVAPPYSMGIQVQLKSQAPLSNDSETHHCAREQYSSANHAQVVCESHSPIPYWQEIAAAQIEKTPHAIA